MKRIHWLMLLGVSGAGLTAALVGPAVWGQPDGKITIPLPAGLTAQPRGYPDLPMLPMEPAKRGNGTVTEPFQPTGQGAVPPAVGAAIAVSPGGLSFDVPPGKQQPAVSVEWLGPTAIRIHQPMPCQIVVRNASTAPAQNVIVRHRLSQGMILKACEPQAVQENGELMWNLGTLAPEQSRRIDLTLIPEARGRVNCHATVTFTAVAGQQVQVREPQLAVKMRAPATTVAGDTVTLLFAVSNPGDGVADRVKLKATLPEGLENPRGKVIEFELGSLAPKDVRTLQLTSIAKGTGPQQCAILATGDGNLTCTDTASVDIVIPRLDIAMAGPKLRYLYRHAVYTLKVTNPGSAPATSVEVQEVIPPGFRLHNAQGGQYQEAIRLVSWKVGDLQPGQSKEIAVDLIPTEIGEHRLIAHAKTARGLKTETEIRTIVEGLSSLEMEVSHTDDPIEVGAESAFEIRVANKGTKTETNVEVVCTLPAQLEFRGAKCTTTLRYRQEGRELVFEKLPRLAPRAEEMFRVQVKGVAPGDIRFRTRIRADGMPDPVQREDGMRIYSDEAPQRSLPRNAPLPAPGLTPSPPPIPIPTPISIPRPVAPMIPTPPPPAR